MTPVNGSTGTHTIAELRWKNAESPYPSAEINHPPGGAINSPPTLRLAQILPITSIDSQSVDIDPADRAWVLDTGHVLTPDGTLVPASYGGPKLVGSHLSNNSVFQTIAFPPTLCSPRNRTRTMFNST